MSHYDCKKCGAAYWQECTCSEGEPMTVEEALDVVSQGIIFADIYAEAAETLADEMRRLQKEATT